MYDSGKRENQGCKMSLIMNDSKMSWETGQWDCGMEELLEAFYGLCVGQTFCPETVLKGMKEFVEERMPEEEEDE